MLGTKQSILTRHYVIDRCLGDPEGMPLARIQEICNDMLPKEDYISSPNTILDDIRKIGLRYNAVVEKIRIGRHILYRYKERNFSIFKQSIAVEAMARLEALLNEVRAIDGLPFQEWAMELEVLLLSNNNGSDKKKRSYIGFEYKKSYGPAMIHFTPLYNAIVGEETLDVKYQSYKRSEPRVITIHPYYLKQHYNRWYLAGLDHENQDVRVYALDRIISIEKSEENYIPNTTIDFDDYFNNIIGVSFNREWKAEDVIIQVTNEQLPYLLSNPIHPSQALIEKNTEGATLKYHLIINYELEQRFLFYGEKITVLYPKNLRLRIMSRIKESIENYQLEKD